MLKSIARQIVFPVLHKSGVGNLLRLGGHQHLNITYHGVVKKSNLRFSPRHISAIQFEQHLKYFTKHFKVINLEEAFRQYREGEQPSQPTINISFDDGFENNLTVLLPLIEKYTVPVTIFVSGRCAETNGNRVLWSELTAALRYSNPQKPVQLGSDRFDLKSKSEGYRLDAYIKSLSPTERAPVIQELTDQHNLFEVLQSVDPEQWRLMDNNQLKQLAASPFIEIGSHGVDHYNMDAIPEEDARFELAKSKSTLEDLTQKQIHSFAYPDGAYNSTTIKLAEEAGYLNQLAVNYSKPSDREDSRILNRFSVPATTTFESNMLQVNRAFHTHGF